MKILIADDDDIIRLLPGSALRKIGHDVRIGIDPETQARLFHDAHAEHANPNDLSFLNAS